MTNYCYWNAFVPLALGLLALAPPTGATDIAGTLTGVVTWSQAESPYRITRDVTIPDGSELHVEPGVQVELNRGVDIVVDGLLSVEGTAEEPIRFARVGSGRWATVVYTESGRGVLRQASFDGGSTGGGNRNGMVSVDRTAAAVLIEDCTFSDWSGVAVGFYQAQDLTIRRCRFGEGSNEAVNGKRSPVLIEGCTFDQRRGYNDAIDVEDSKIPDPVPHIIGNTFLGCEDDAIDLDRCDAYVEGNLIFRCRGGSHDPIGISGDAGSQPVIVNNVIIECENGIAFKNGADITVLNNTIINCGRGIWMHQDSAYATVRNTIIWGRADQESIVLEAQSTIDIRGSLVRGEPVYPGEANTNTQPDFVDPESYDFHLREGSLCIDAGVALENVLTDFDGTPRPQGPAFDIGAYEFALEAAAVFRWRNW